MLAATRHNHLSTQPLTYALHLEIGNELLLGVLHVSGIYSCGLEC